MMESTASTQRLLAAMARWETTAARLLAKAKRQQEQSTQHPSGGRQ